MRILSRYFVLGYLTYYAAIVTVSILVIAIVEMMVNFDHVIEYGEGLRGAASYLFLRLPSYYLPFLLPVGSFGAAFLCVGLPARSLEILAAKSGGVAPARLAAPILAAATALSILALVLNETVVRDTARRLRHDPGGELFQSRGAFWYQRGHTLFRVDSADRDARTLQGVTIYERDAAGRLLRSVHAETAHIESDRRWRLERVLYREFPADDPEAAPRTEARASDWFELGTAEDLALLDADARSLSLVRLRDYILAIEREGRDTTRYRSMWHMRLADPLSVLLFAAFGAPLGMVVERSRSVAVAGLQGVLVVGVYYALQAVAGVFGAGGVSGAAVAPWFAPGALAAAALWRFARIAA